MIWPKVNTDCITGMQVFAAAVLLVRDDLPLRLPHHSLAAQWQLVPMALCQWSMRVLLGEQQSLRDG